MRRNILLLALVLFGFGPLVPSSATAQETVLAQAKSSKKKKKKEASRDETASDAPEKDEAASDAPEKGEKTEKDESPAEPEETTEALETAEDGELSEEPSADGSEASVETARVARVPLEANFSKAEMLTTGAVFVGGVGAIGAGARALGAVTPSMQPPRVGSLDYNVSANFHGNLADPGKLLFGIPDITGLYILPFGATAFYFGSAGYYWSTGDTLFGQTVNIDHSAIAFAEAFGWSSLATGVLKLLVGRERPYKAFNRPQFIDEPLDDPNAFLSFPSGHTSASFVIASYLAWDISDHLVYKRGSGFWTGRVIPFVSLYGVASLVGISRIYDQKHWTSDVMVGALLGSAIGNLVYVVHFDREGNPRIRHPEAMNADDVEVTLGPITIVDGDTGVGLVGRW